MFTKQCARPGCFGEIAEETRSALKRRTFCSRACVQWKSAETRRQGQEEESLRRALAKIAKALGVSGPLPPGLVRTVRVIRMRAYQAGWRVVERRIRRKLATGELVYQRDKAMV